MLRRVASYSALQALAQTVLVASAFLVASLASPAQFGEYATFLSIATTISAFITLSHDALIAGSRNETETFLLLRGYGKNLLITSCFGVLIALVLHLTEASATSLGLATLITSIAVSGTTVISSYCLQIGKSSLAAIPRLTFAVSLVPCQLILLNSTIPNQLIWGHASSQLISGLVALTAYALYRPKPKQLSSGARTQWRGNRQFVVAGVLSTVGNNLPVPVISGVLGSEWAGYFALTSKVLGAPLLLLGNAVSSALVPELARRNLPRRLLYRVSASTALGFALTVTPLIQTGIITTLGLQWAAATPVLLIFVPVFSARIATIPAVASVAAARDGQFLLGWEILRIGCLGFGALLLPGLDPIPWLCTLSILWSGVYLLLLARGYQASPRETPGAMSTAP